MVVAGHGHVNTTRKSFRTAPRQWQTGLAQWGSEYSSAGTAGNLKVSSVLNETHTGVRVSPVFTDLSTQLLWRPPSLSVATLAWYFSPGIRSVTFRLKPATVMMLCSWPRLQVTLYLYDPGMPSGGDQLTVSESGFTEENWIGPGGGTPGHTGGGATL